MNEAIPIEDRRRSFLKWLIYGSWGAFALAGALPALALKTLNQTKPVVAAGDQLVYAVGGNAGQPINMTALPVNSGIQAFPKDKAANQDNLIEVVKLSSSVVAYSAICTHLGCSVSPALTQRGLIGCPCHASLYDPANNAAVVGGPAPRPLPGLPITVNPDGTVTANGTFDAPIGQGA